MTPITKLLSRTAKITDIPDKEYQRIEELVKSLANHLSNDHSVSKYEPKLYIQGSFKLGTVVRSIIDNYKYDVDIICELSSLSKENISQEQLRNIIGEAIRRHPKYGKFFKLNKPGERCWTAEIDVRLKIDIVPAVPDLENNNRGILIQGKEHRWKKTNPEGFFIWFQSRNMKYQPISDATVNLANLEGMPKSPLQQVIQIIKLFRDVYFEDNPKLKPASIIITFLVAENYEGEADPYKALCNATKALKNYDCSREISIGENEENLADRLNKNEDCQRAFDGFAECLYEGVSSLEAIDNLKSPQEFSTLLFGQPVSNAIFKEEDFGLKNKTDNIDYPEVKITASEAPLPWLEL